MIRNKRVVITGGAGFIGSSLARRLVEENEVVLVDRSFDALSPFLRDHHRVFEVEADVRETPALIAAAAGADIIIHAAAILGVRKVIRESLLTMEVNLEGTSSALRAASAVGDIDRFVYFSTSEVFGSSAFRAVESEHTLVGTVQDARWSYAISKLAGEHLTAAYHRENGLPAVIIRPFNVFGPGRTGDYAIIRFVAAALNGENLVVHGDGVQLRSWCHIEDFLDGLTLAIESPNAVGHVFNIGNARNTVTILDLAERIVRLTGSSSQVVHEDSGMVDIDVRVPSTGNARDRLGYEPRINLDDALRDTIEWYAEHPEVLRPFLTE